MTTESVVASCVENKLRWLGFRLRWVDDPLHLKNLIKVMNGLTVLMQSLRAATASLTQQKNRELLQGQCAHPKNKKKQCTISPQCVVTIAGENPELTSRSVKRRRSDIVTKIDSLENTTAIIDEQLWETTILMEEKDTVATRKLMEDREAQDRTREASYTEAKDERDQIGVYDSEMTIAEELTEDLSGEVITTIWKDELLQRLNVRNWNYDGCEYKGLLGEWHPTEELLRDIARAINRSGNNDLKDNTLRALLVDELNKFCG